MANNFKIKKALRLMEEFAAQEPVVKTNIDSVGTKPTAISKSGDQVRAEIVQDVDTILTNLETLSKQITEEVDSLLENTNWGEDDALNENFMENMIKTFKSMKSFARLQASWPKMYQDKLNLEIQNVKELGNFELKAGEKEEKMTAAVKQKFDAKKKAITASDIPTEKKKAARAQVDQVYKDSEGKIKEKIKKQIDTKKAVILNKHKQAADKLSSEMSEFEADNKIEAELIQKRWSLIKTNKQNQMDNDHIEAKSEAELEFMDADNPEAIKKAQERLKKLKADMKAEDAAALKQKEDDLKAAEAEAEARAQEGSEEEKEANAKILTFYKTGNVLRNALKSQKPEDYDDAAKLEIKKLKTAFNDAKNKVTGSVFVTGKVADDEAEGEEIANGLKDDVKEMLADFKAVLDAAGGSKSDLEKATEAAKKAVDDADDELETEKLSEDEAKIKAAKIKLLDAKIAHETAKKAEAADKGDDTAKFDEKIAQHEESKSLLSGGGGTTEKTSKQLADEYIEGNEGFEVVQNKDEEVTVNNPDTGEDEQKPKYEGQKEFKGKKEDGSDDDSVWVAKPIQYSDTQSANTGGGKALNEGVHAKIKKAMKAVEAGETVYGENIRFPGRFKIVSFNKDGSMAKVDYEDGTDAFDMAAMNIAIDKLQFEAVVTEASLSGIEFGNDDDIHPTKFKPLVQSLKKNKVKMEVEKEKGMHGYPEVKLTGKRKDIEKVLADIWGPDSIEDYEDYFESAEIEEGNEFGAARAEAIAKGEKTFKVGDKEYPVEDVSKDDKENAKEFVEEAKEELPKKVKLYEGMSIADRFKALM